MFKQIGDSLKAVFIPHRGNQYKPHAIRGVGLAVFAAYILVFQGIYNYQASGSFRVLGYATNVSVGDLHAQSNAQRAANGLAGYSLNSQLNQAAQAKANHMIANNYWSHYAPDGTTPWDFIDASGYAYQRAGENLAYGFATSSGTVSGWMNSPSHKANVLDAGFREVGYGIANGANFQGDENTVIVAVYAQPTAVAPAIPTPTTEPANTVAATETAPTPVAETETPKQETKKQDKKPERPETESTEPTDVPIQETEDGNTQRLLAQLAENGGIIVTGETTNISLGDGRISNIQALVSGQAHWSLYMVVGGMLAMAIIYFVRHLQAIGQVVVHGEHYVVGHPTLEASIVYLAIWLILFATFGVVQ